MPKAIIRNFSEVEARNNITGHPNLTAWRLLDSEQKETAFLSLALDDIRPGGGIVSHYHTHEAPFDHVYYVISGQIAAKLGDAEEQVVGDDTVIYCPSDMAHSIKNVGKTNARVLRIGASATGDVRGKTVYL